MDNPDLSLVSSEGWEVIMTWFRVALFGVTLGLFSSSAALAQGMEAAVRRPADRADVGSVDAIIAAVYDVISGPAGVRDWDRMRSLFIPEARLIAVGEAPDGSFTKRVMSLEDYIGRAGAYFEQNGFVERELARRTERFEHIAHAFSTYESLHSVADPEPFSRGINSFQLMHDGERWWIVTIYWEAETPDKPIPDKYLP